MVIHGELLKISYISGEETLNLSHETRSVLTIKEDFINYSGTTSRCLKYKQTAKTWDISGQMFFDYEDLKMLHSAMVDGITPTFTFGGAYDTHIINVSGKAIITSVSFSAQGKDILSVNIKLQGTGAPVISLS